MSISLLKQLSKYSLSNFSSYCSTTDKKILLTLKNKSDDLYYNSSSPILSDSLYDILKDSLSHIPEVKTKIGHKIRDDNNKISLPFNLGSCNKITRNNPKLLDKWLDKIDSKSFIITDKLDGVSCLYQFSNDSIKLYTRGDGEIGSDISHLQKYISIPKPSDNNDIFIRGELIMKNDIFMNKYLDKYKNPRNMVSGIISGKTFKSGLKDIDFVVYEILDNSHMNSQESQLIKLKSLGFNIVSYDIVSRSNINIDNLEEILIKHKTKSLYNIDGIVIQHNDKYDRNIDGNPDYNFAFKMLDVDNIKKTNVQEICWQVSRYGLFKPVVIVDPVDIQGITIKKLTGHNAKYIIDNKIGVDSIIEITRSNDVIPYIVNVIKESDDFMLPSNYSWDKNNVNICINTSNNDIKDNDDMEIKNISTFFQKIGVKFVSEQTIRKLYENGLTSILDIIKVDKKFLLTIPTIKEKTAERILSNIKSSLSNISIDTLLSASGIFGSGLGIKKLNLLLTNIPNLFELYVENELCKEQLLSIEGFSHITTDIILDNIDKAYTFYKNIKPFIIIKKEVKKSDLFLNKKIVLTGFRDKKVEEFIVNNGGKVMNSVSKNTSLLIYSGDTDSSKYIKSVELNIPIISKSDFYSKYLK